MMYRLFHDIMPNEMLRAVYPLFSWEWRRRTTHRNKNGKERYEMVPLTSPPGQLPWDATFRSLLSSW